MKLKKMGITLPYDVSDRVQAMAEREHEGNFARMVRELLREALEARDREAGAGALDEAA